MQNLLNVFCPECGEQVLLHTTYSVRYKPSDPWVCGDMALIAGALAEEEAIRQADLYAAADYYLSEMAGLTTP